MVHCWIDPSEHFWLRTLQILFAACPSLCEHKRGESKGVQVFEKGELSLTFHNSSSADNLDTPTCGPVGGCVTKGGRLLIQPG